MIKNNIYRFLILISFIISTEFISAQNKLSNFKIVIPAKPNENEIEASNILQKYLNLVTDSEIKIITDSEPEFEFEILLGNNNRLSKFNISTDSIDKDGYSIITIENKLVIIGGSKKGLLYGVYTFLDKYLGCKMFTPDVIEIPKNSEIILPQINLVENPKIIYRELHLPSARTSQLFCDWHKLHHYSEREKYYGSFVHTFENLVPSDKYFKEHPEYFSEINGNRIPHQQLCLTNPNVYKIVVDELKNKMKERPEAEVWDVSQNDNFGNCTCKNCRTIDSIHGSPAATMLNFVNKVAKEFPNKTISTLAYQYTRKAPIGIKTEPNVMVVLCTIECDRSKPISENKDDLFNRDIEEWSKLSNNIKIWDYVVQFSSYTDPFPNFHVLQPNLQMFVDHGVKYLFEQGSGDSWSDFHEMKAYVLAKLLWNPNDNVQNIIDEFLKGYYGDASKYLRNYFDLMHTSLQKSGGNLIIYGYPSSGKESYLTPELLKKYTVIFNEAEKSVMDNPTFLERVKTARLPLEYAILELSKLNVSKDFQIFDLVDNKVFVREEMKNRLQFFVDNANKAGIKALHERGKSPDEYYMEMQKYFEDGMIVHKAYKKNVNIISQIHPNYFVKGNETLTDGTTGEANYFFNWLGFEANEFEAIVDLKEKTNINLLRTNFLQEHKSWIWLPKVVEYYISDNGINFEKVGEVKNEIDERKEGIFSQAFTLNVNNVSAKFVKVKTKSLINCPVWHIGYTNGTGKAWLFVDEIIVN
ncbi:MAG: DUF4838 domain-containing protein [Ignavibacteriae bacterium]|nr:DUF4838 domain-containing protein [Ignavibacteriota bacterium]